MVSTHSHRITVSQLERSLCVCIDSVAVKNFTIPDTQQKFYCGQNVLLAHSQAYHLGKKMVANSTIAYKNGQLGLNVLEVSLLTELQ